MEVKIGVSNRHIHLTKEVLNILYGDNYELECIKELTQKGQFTTNATVTIKSVKGKIEKVRVLAPLREYTQVEISMTDAYKLGVNPPVRNSGDLANSSSLTIIGPKGEITLDNCCIIASRHIHINKDKMKELGLENKEYVKVKFDTNRPAILEGVYLKVTDLGVFEMHIDTDEANALGLKQGDIGTIIEEEV